MKGLNDNIKTLFDFATIANIDLRAVSKIIFPYRSTYAGEISKFSRGRMPKLTAIQQKAVDGMLHGTDWLRGGYTDGLLTVQNKEHTCFFCPETGNVRIVRKFTGLDVLNFEIDTKISLIEFTNIINEQLLKLKK